MWLAVREEPDHNTLWRFFRDNKKALKSLESVKTQWSLLCTTVNLSKLYKHWLSGNLSFAGAKMNGNSPSIAGM